MWFKICNASSACDFLHYPKSNLLDTFLQNIPAAVFLGRTTDVYWAWFTWFFISCHFFSLRLSSASEKAAGPQLVISACPLEPGDVNKHFTHHTDIYIYVHTVYIQYIYSEFRGRHIHMPVLTLYKLWFEIIVFKQTVVNSVTWLNKPEHALMCCHLVLPWPRVVGCIFKLFHHCLPQAHKSTV